MALAYPEEDGGLWRRPFEWVLGQAKTQGGLLVDQGRLHDVLHRTEPSPTPWLDAQHESLTWKWWTAEFFPKTPGLGWRIPRINFGRYRQIRSGATLDQTTLLRIRDHNAGYAPPNFSPAFLAHVRTLKTVPEVLPYSPSPPPIALESAPTLPNMV